MPKLVLTSDIHGSLKAWNKIKSLVNAEDTLAVAGDLFDTIYGSNTNPDFQPELIMEEFTELSCKKYYVYGNCDSTKFYKNQKNQLNFTFNGYRIFLNHGHLHLPDLTDYDIIVEGHSHIAKLNSIMGKVFLNPGSIPLPRENGPTYSIFEDGVLQVVDAGNDESILSLGLD